MGVLYVSGGESFVIGRDKGCNPHLDGSYVSRRHLTVDPVTSDVAVVCVLGTNGAVVGGRKVNKGFRGYLTPFCTFSCIVLSLYINGLFCSLHFGYYFLILASVYGLFCIACGQVAD